MQKERVQKSGGEKKQNQKEKNEVTWFEDTSACSQNRQKKKIIHFSSSTAAKISQKHFSRIENTWGATLFTRTHDADPQAMIFPAVPGYQ